MRNEAPLVQVEFAPEFKRNLRVLAKKYRHIRSDLQPVLATPSWIRQTSRRI